MCGGFSNNIVQVDRGGRQILAKVVTENDGVFGPSSVYCSRHKGSIIVGMGKKNDIIVFKAQ